MHACIYNHAGCFHGWCDARAADAGSLRVLCENEMCVCRFFVHYVVIENGSVDSYMR